MSIYKAENDGRTYWATWRHEDLLPHLMNKIDAYFHKLKQDGILDLWQDVDNAFYNYEDGEHEGSKIKFNGPGGETITIRSSVFRNMVKHMLGGILAQQPQYVPVASNDDYDTKKQVYACKNALDHYYRAKKIKTIMQETTLHATLKGVGYTVQTWDKQLSDLEVASYGPRRVITDLQSFHDPQWFIVTKRMNRWDVAARYGVKGDKLDELTNINIASHSEIAGAGYLFDETSQNDDYIDVFYFFHAPTPALPQGRYVAFCNDRVNFTKGTDEVLPYKHMPVHMFLPDKILDSPYGYSPAFDIVAYALMYDAGLSTMYTQLDNARSVVAIPQDSEGPVEEADGLMLVRYPTDKQHSGIQVVNTYNVPQGMFQTMETTKKEIMETVGQNSTSLGESEAKSGSHAALLHTVSQQFNAPFIGRFVDHAEELGTSQIWIIKKYVDEPVQLQISGIENEFYLQDFRGEDIELVDSVTVKAVSPMLSTTTGRLTIAQDLIKIPNSGFTAKDYIKVMDTGELDSSFYEDRDLDMALSAERDALSDYDQVTIGMAELVRQDGSGMPDRIEVIEEVRALVTDNHQQHIEDHKNTLNSPRVRNNPRLVKIHNIHIREHIWLWRYGDPDMLHATGQQPIPPREAGTNSGQNPQPPQPPGPPRGQMQAPPMANQQNPQPRQLPSGPGMPQNPMGQTPTGAMPPQPS